MGLLVRQPARPALDAACAAWLAQRLGPRPGGRPRVFAVCGGRSVEGIFAALAARTDLHWPSIHLFLVDERVVAADHPDSNQRQVQAALVEPLFQRAGLPAASLHGFDLPQRPAMADAAAAAEACNGALLALGGRFDAVLLSAGEDGHVASLFPGHRSIDDPSAGYIAFDDSPKPPPGRISASRRLLMGARSAALVFAGEAKRAALSAFIACSEGESGGPAGRDRPAEDGRPAPARAALDIRCHPACLVRSLPEWAAFTDLDPDR